MEPMLPVLEAGCWVRRSRGCRALLAFAVLGMLERQEKKSLLNPELPGWGRGGALCKVKLPLGPQWGLVGSLLSALGSAAPSAAKSLR